MTTAAEALGLAVHTIAAIRGWSIEQELPDGTEVAPNECAWHMTKPSRSGPAIRHVVMKIGYEIVDVEDAANDADEAWRAVERAFDRHDPIHEEPDAR